MLGESISKVEMIVSETKTKVEALIEQGKQKVESGVEVARRCSGVLNEIVENVSTVSSLAQEISQASKEQSQGVGEINKAMASLDTVTQQNATASEQTSTAAGSLSHQAVTLKSVVDDLVATIQGSGGSRNATPEHHEAPQAKKSNVVMMKPKAKQSAPAPKKQHHAAPARHSPEPLKKASGGEQDVPNRDNASFED